MIKIGTALALQNSTVNVNVANGLNPNGVNATLGGAQQRLRSTLVIGELAIALILLIGAGLLVKTFWKLRSVDPGFKSDHLLTMRVELPVADYQEVEPQTRVEMVRHLASDEFDAQRNCGPNCLQTNTNSWLNKYVQGLAEFPNVPAPPQMGFL